MTKNEMNREFAYALEVATEGLSSEGNSCRLDMSEFEEFFAAIDALSDEKIEALAEAVGIDVADPSHDEAMIVDYMSFESHSALRRHVTPGLMDDHFSLHEEISNVSMFIPSYDGEICELDYDLAFVDMGNSWNKEVASNYRLSHVDRLFFMSVASTLKGLNNHVLESDILARGDLTQILNNLSNNPIYCDWSSMNNSMEATAVMALQINKRHAET